MERKQSFFSSLKGEILRTMSPSKTARMARSLCRGDSNTFVVQSTVKSTVDGLVFGSMKSGVLSPLREGPPESEKEKTKIWGRWMTKAGKISCVASLANSESDDLRLLLGVLGAPLVPVSVKPVDSAPPRPVLAIDNAPIESLSAQYILQQYIAATGGSKLLSSIRNTYVMGKVKMQTSEDGKATTKLAKSLSMGKTAESGGFVLWQMNPDMWYIELSVGGTKVHVGCNGKFVWRHTPWAGPHASKGPIRPLRRSIQGLDPRSTSNMFAKSRCTGEKNISGEGACFILKLCADPETLKSRTEGPTEIIRHILFGYFSQKTGLLVHLEDSQLTRIQSNTGGDAVYWETTINSSLHDYRDVDGVMIAHSGKSAITFFGFGETEVNRTGMTRLEEEWTIEEVGFNVHGLSMDCFIPIADVKFDGSSLEGVCDIVVGYEKGKPLLPIGISGGGGNNHRAKVASIGGDVDNNSNNETAKC
ncbi:hypothetical protein ZOSMA_53G00920 [Zostera marina]|uniref:Uncharacterized protein n=1 Tax=Zostera marina TaxID=29655 RepID=A0A0K9NZ81_ZOSMR|nr:hypothetical protein ZOSMA_53G00920 [Zostera marina]